MLTGERVLVTGATGQVARPIAEQLNGRNEVWAAARFRDQEAKAELEAAGIHTAPFTLGEAELSHLPDVDYVIHCAANVAPKSADRGIAINAEGTGFLMERYGDASGFFHMSSSSVYRAGPDPTTPFHEGDPLGGEASYSPHYAMSKLASEAVVRFQSRRLGLPTVIARLNVAYGTSGHGGLPMVLYEFLRNDMAVHETSRTSTAGARRSTRTTSSSRSRACWTIRGRTGGSSTSAATRWSPSRRSSASSRS